MTVLTVRGLAKAFGGVIAVDGVDFDIAAGEIVAMIGPNGAGKSTCFNLIGGQLRPDSGSIQLDGREIAGLAAHHIWRLGIGRTFQIAAVFASLSVRENIQVALLSAHRRAHALVSVAGRLHRGEADDLLDLAGLTGDADRQASTLAYGDLKRLELVIALAHGPRLLLLDEPTAGIALDDRRRLMKTIVAIVGERRISVLFTEHDMDVVFGHADRVLVLHRGRLIAQGAPKVVRANARVQEVYLGSLDDSWLGGEMRAPGVAP